MMPLVGLLLFEAMVIAVGLLVVRLLLPRGDRHPAELWLPLAFAVGLMIHAAVLMGSLATLGFFTAWHLPMLAILAVILHALLMKSGRLAPIGGFAILRHSGASNATAFYWLLAFIVLARLVMLHAEALRFPLFTWDGRFIWNYKAIVLFHEGTVFTDSFMDPARVHFHRDYPLLLPGAYLGVYQAGGAISERMARLFLVHLMVFFVMAFHGALRGRCAPWMAMFFTALFAAAPFRMDYTVRDGITLTTGVADVPMAFFAFLAVVLHGRGWMSRRNGWHLLGGLMTGACLLTKSEGIVVLAAISGANVAAALCLRAVQWRTRLSALATSLAVPVLVAAPWLALKVHLPNFYDEKFADLVTEAGVGPLADRLPILLSMMMEELMATRSWNLVWPVFVAAFAVAVLANFRRLRWYPGLVVVLWLPAYALAYLVTPLDIRYHVETSIGRLLSHFHAIALLQIALIVGIWSRGPAGRFQSH